MSDKLTTQGGPIERRKTYELVADRLTAEIRARRLSPGDALPPERELVESYQVGRSSVREALRMLESRGLIVDRGNGAFAIADFRNPLNSSLDFLISIEEASYAELFEVRRVLEGEAAALAASRRRRGHLAALADAVEAMEGGLGSEETFIAADLSFHLVVAEATGNRVVLHLMHAIRELLHRSLESSYHIPGSPESAVEMHRLIHEAIAEKRPEEARQRMQEHVARVERDISRGGKGAQ